MKIGTNLGHAMKLSRQYCDAIELRFSLSRRERAGVRGMGKRFGPVLHRFNLLITKKKWYDFFTF